MQEVVKIPDSDSVNYFSSLLQKSNGISSKAKKYVALKNVEIQERLQNGQQTISSKQSEIKIMKNNPDNDQSRMKQNNESDNKKVQRKKLVIQDPQNLNKAEQQKIDSKKQINEEDRMKFVKQKIRQNKLIAKRKQQFLRKQKQEQLKERKLHQQQLLKKQQDSRNKRMQKTRQKIQLIQKRKQQRIAQNHKANKILKEKLEENILAQKIYDKFLSNQNLALDQKKKKLAQIRQLHKPMDRQQIEDHMRKFEESKLQRSRKKQLQLSSIQKNTQKNQYYRSVFHDILQKQQKSKQDEQIQQQYRLKELKQRSKKYAEQVKVQFRPEIDEKKRQEIQKRVKSSSLINPNPIDNRFKGNQYMEFAKEYASKFKKQTPDPKIQKLLARQDSNKTQQTDYLTLSRKKNAESRLKRSATSANDFIKKIEKKNLTSQQRQQKIIQFAEGQERKARYKQKFLNSVSPYQTDQEVDKLYISAIQAKLKALQR